MRGSGRICRQGFWVNVGEVYVVVGRDCELSSRSPRELPGSPNIP